MFTGLIEDIGTLRSRTPHGEDVTLEIATSLPLDGCRLGDSIAVNGACLTVTAMSGDRFSVDASTETLARTSLAGLRVGDRVHLERAMAVGDRLGGHIVQGHVDGTGRLVRRTPSGRSWDLWFDVSEGVRAELVPKGSVTVDGVSLTVNEVGSTGFRVTIIPHTEARTLLIDKPVGAVVNIETDVLGKYVRRFLGLDASGGLGELLQRFGYTAPGEG